MAQDSKSGTKIPADIAKLSFEDALAQLEEIVRGLESGEAAFEDALDAYERGAALKRRCEEILREAQARVDKISLGADGALESEAVETD